MFCGGMLEARPGISVVVDVEDVSYDALEAFLFYCYTAEIRSLVSSARLAVISCCSPLIQVSELQPPTQETVGLVCSLLVLADRYVDVSLAV
jgi:hypothetical protein